MQNFCSLFSHTNDQTSPLLELAEQQCADGQGTWQHEPERDDGSGLEREVLKRVVRHVGDDGSGLEREVLKRVVRHVGDDGSGSSGGAHDADEERQRSGL